jgi:hypothetical protein
MPKDREFILNAAAKLNEVMAKPFLPAERVARQRKTALFLETENAKRDRSLEDESGEC